MTQEELKLLKDAYEKELEKRNEVLKLLEDEKVLKFLSLTRQTSSVNNLKHSYSLEADDIFRDILTKMSLSGSSEIYFLDYETEDTYGRKNYYANLESYDNDYAKKVYDEDIEKFEKEHDVLDKNNPLYQEDGCRVAQANFFLEAFKNGPEVAKKKILEMYGTTKNINS